MVCRFEAEERMVCMSSFHRPMQRQVPLELARSLQAQALQLERAVHALERENEVLKHNHQVVVDDYHALERDNRALARDNEELRSVLASRPVPTLAPPAPEPERNREPESEGQLQRLVADLQNVRRHRDEQIDRARLAEKIEGLRRLADVYDTLLLGLQSLPEQHGPWFDGQRVIVDQVGGYLASAGARPFGVAGEHFDPKLHEAVGTALGQADTLLAVQQVGFRLDDGALVRPARVIVGVS